MEESSANKATELVALSSLHTETALAKCVGQTGLCDRRDVEEQISVPPRREHGELLTTGTASIALDVAS